MPREVANVQCLYTQRLSEQSYQKCMTERDPSAVKNRRQGDFQPWGRSHGPFEKLLSNVWTLEKVLNSQRHALKQDLELMVPGPYASDADQMVGLANQAFQVRTCHLLLTLNPFHRENFASNV